MQNLRAAAAVGVPVSQKSDPDPARRARGDQPFCTVLTFCTDASCHAERPLTIGNSFLQHAFQFWQIGGHILPVTIQHPDQIAARHTKGRSDCGTLAGASFMAQDTQLRDITDGLREFSRTIICAGVIYIDDLKVKPGIFVRLLTRSAMRFPAATLRSSM